MLIVRCDSTGKFTLYSCEFKPFELPEIMLTDLPERKVYKRQTFTRRGLARMLDKVRCMTVLLPGTNLDHIVFYLEITDCRFWSKQKEIGFTY